MTLGAKSTEFWVALGCILVGVVLVWLGVAQHRDIVLVTGAGLMAAAGASYAFSRGRVKGPRPYPPGGRGGP